MTENQTAPTVLIVDDTAFNRKKLTAALSALGIDPITAVDGRSGLDQMRANSCDLVLLDIIMPGKDGFDAVSYTHLTLPTKA